jgi:hypothetical protein
MLARLVGDALLLVKPEAAAVLVYRRYTKLVLVALSVCWLMDPSFGRAYVLKNFLSRR